MIELWWNLKDALAGKQAIGWVSFYSYNCSSLRSNSASNVWSTICVPLPTLCIHSLTPKSHSLLQELQLITSCLLRSHPTWYFLQYSMYLVKSLLQTWWWNVSMQTKVTPEQKPKQTMIEMIGWNSPLCILYNQGLKWGIKKQNHPRRNFKYNHENHHRIGPQDFGPR